MQKINYYMQQAIKIALSAGEKNEVPVGCIIVHNDEIIAREHNMIEQNNNSTQHAEIIAINKAMKKLNSKYLDACDIYITMEPCIMCSGAISHSKIRKVIFGCYDLNNGCIEHNGKIFSKIKTNHTPEVIGGIEIEKCQKIIKDFFVNKRKKND